MAGSPTTGQICSVAVAPSPANEGRFITLEDGQGAEFPDPPFSVVIWPHASCPVWFNAELAVCEVVDGDTLTLFRDRWDTMPRSILVGDNISHSMVRSCFGPIYDGARINFFDDPPDPWDLTGIGPPY